MEAIRSATNIQVKRVRAVRAGKEPSMVLLEGERLVGDAVASGLKLELVLISEDRPDLLGEFERGLLIDAELLGRISDLKTSSGILALACVPMTRDASEIETLVSERSNAAPALVLVVDGVADPVNLGALARSAEAAGACLLVHVVGGARPYSTRAVRGSMGSLLRLPIVLVQTVEEARLALEAVGLLIVRPDTRGGVDWCTVDWAPPMALWIGGETRAAEIGGRGVSIPMAGGVESLNVTVAASLLLFAAQRARLGLAL